ncbi:AMP-binding protein [Streptomyces zingiberis]|uniref:AMP-binding protein n=1 Tax=Streptomyces zingiberis TaxID=2053010 RepID=A0ABX1C7A7_9ACTN|nr:AMP-binding protein [Streptomyces zingiberis]NJQ03742.1 AMP-binding protein [Streptomyces zingiberis]
MTGDCTATGLLPALHAGAARIEVAGERLAGGELAAAVGGVAREVSGARRVAVTAHPELSTLVAVAGVLAAGAAAVPLTPAAGPAEREHILRDARVDLVLDRPALVRRGDPPPDPPPDGEPALILYTSGSTGPPKGAVIPRRAIAANLDALAGLWRWTPEDHLVHALPFSHVHGLVFGGLGPLRLGCSLTHTGHCLRAVPGGTLYFGVPALWGSLGAADLAELRAARLLVSGADVLPRRVAERVHHHCGHHVLNRYAMTETLVIASPRAEDTRVPVDPRSVGRPLPGTRVRLAPHGAEPGIGDGAEPRAGCGGSRAGAGAGERAEAGGEILVRGDGLFSGYLGRGPATGPGGWFATGDLGEWLPDGTLRVTGRAHTDLIKSGGYRVGAGEVEDALLDHPGVAEAAVLGLPDDRLGQRVAAWVVTGGRLDRAELTAFLAARLAPYKLPQEIHTVEALPRNALGKVLKRRLAAERRS